MKILNFGSCNIDYVYKLSHFVRPGETVNSIGYDRFPGGKGLNQSTALGRAGCSVYHAGAIGQDGNFLREILEKSGVDTTFLETLPSASGHALIQVDEKGENCIILHGGANRQIRRERVDEIISEFGCGDILLLQNEINDIDYIIDTADREGLQVILNPAPFDENIRRLDFSKIHTLILNETEAEGFCGSRDTEQIRRYFGEKYEHLHVVLTLGADGCAYFDVRMQVTCPAFEVQAVDTTAAGDTFIGYYIYGLANKLNIRHTLTLASAASAITVSRPGASSSIPTMKEVEMFIEMRQDGREFLDADE